MQNISVQMSGQVRECTETAEFTNCTNKFNSIQIYLYWAFHNIYCFKCIKGL